MPLAKKYVDERSPFNDWLTATETKLDLIEQTPLKLESIQESLKELGKIQDDVNTRARDYKSVQQCGEGLLKTAQEDKKVVDAELGKTEKRWVALRTKLESTKDKLEKQQKALEGFEDGVNIMEEVFTPCEAVLAERKPYGLSDEVAKREINKIEELLVTVKQRQPIADKIPKLYEDLTKDAEETEPEAVAMKETVNDIYTKSRDVPEKLQTLKETLEDEVKHLTTFSELIR